MKIHIAAALLAVLSFPAHAADADMTADGTSPSACSGHAEGYYGGLTLTNGAANSDIHSFGGAVRANCNFDRRWNAQGDLFIDSLRNTQGTISTISNYGAAGHLYWRNPSTYAVGGFVSVEGYDGLSSFDGTARTIFGVEGQAYLDRATLYGQAYYGKHTINSTSADIKGVRGVVRYFPTDNLRLEGELGYREFTTPSGGLDMVTFGAEATYRFDNSPFSVFGRYQLDHMSISSGATIDAHKYVAGLRVSFGSRTLFDEDRNGATMDLPRSNYFVY